MAIIVIRKEIFDNKKDVGDDDDDHDNDGDNVNDKDND